MEYIEGGVTAAKGFKASSAASAWLFPSTASFKAASLAAFASFKDAISPVAWSNCFAVSAACVLACSNAALTAPW